MRPSLRAVAVAAAAASLLFAIAPRDARAERPFQFTTRAYVTEPGRIFAEAGGLGFMEGSDVVEAGAIASLAYGLPLGEPRVEIYIQSSYTREPRFGTNAVTPRGRGSPGEVIEEEEEEEEEDDVPVGRFDLVDAFAGIRILLIDGQLYDGGDWPTVVLDVLVLIPSTRKPTANHAGLDAIIEASYTFDPVDCHLNVGYELQEDDPQHSSIFYSFAAYVPLPYGLVYNEWELDFVFEFGGEKVESERVTHFGLVGLVLTLIEIEDTGLTDLYFDAGFFRSLSTSAPEWGFTAGLSFGL